MLKILPVSMLFFTLVVGCDSKWRAIAVTANEEAKKTLEQFLGEQNVKRNELAIKLDELKQRSLELEKTEAQSKVRVGLIESEIADLEMKAAEETEFLRKLQAKASGDGDVEIGGKTYSASKLKLLAAQKELEIKKRETRIKVARQRKKVIEQTLVILPKLRSETSDAVAKLELTLFEIDQKIQLLDEKDATLKLATISEEGDLDAETRKLVEDVKSEVGGAESLADARLDALTQSMELSEIEDALKSDL